MEGQSQTFTNGYDHDHRVKPIELPVSQGGTPPASDKTFGKSGTWRGFEGFMYSTGFLGGSNSVYDAWLTAATGQVGTIILTLPYTMSQMGIAWAVACLVGFAMLGWWAVYLLSWMFFDYKAILMKQNKPLPKGHVAQYQDVIGGVAGKWAYYITLFFILSGNIVGAVVQIVLGSSNLYYANDRLDKRQWAFVLGGLSFVSIFVPDFRHFRPVSLIGVISSLIPAIYLIVTSRIHHQEGHVSHSGPKDHLLFFTGLTNCIFTFGGHGITIEIMEAMKRPSKYKYIYSMVIVYSVIVIIPVGISVYLAYGDVLLTHSNALSVLPPTGWRSFAVACVVTHEVLLFMLVSCAIFISIEKMVGVHTGKYIIRLLVRIPILLIIWLIALAIPFFALLNSFMGAVMFNASGYLMPPFFFAFAYRTAAARESSVQQPPRLLGGSWALLFTINAFIVLLMATIGFGWGGWASVTDIVKQIQHVGFFAKCYQCAPAAPTK